MSRWLVMFAVSAACSRASSSGAPAVTQPTHGHAAATVDPDAAPVKTRILDRDETVTTASGATFTASAGWRVEDRPEAITLVGPEGDLRISYVEVADQDRDKAIAAAWKRVTPELVLEVADAIDLPSRDGWDTHVKISYVTPATEQREVFLVARRKGPTWFIALVDGKHAALDRRSAQMSNAITSLTVKGLEKESFAGKKANRLDAARIGELDRFIEEARAMTNVPGAAVAVVQDGAVALAKGYGVKQRGKKSKVGPRTLFMIGSITKPITSLMMARLIDQGKFTWDTPVTVLLPSFALGDPATTKRVQMRHTVCACTGMPSQNVELCFEYASAEDRLASMKSMMPTTDFGETFQYSNLMVSAGGFAAAHAYAPQKKLLPAYEDAMKALVFDPLGMKSTTFDFKRVARGDHAAPHRDDLQGELVAMAVETERWVIPVAPAGATWSNVDDMARFVAVELGKGKLGGKQFVSEQQLLARRAPQVKLSDEASYGLAWDLVTENGLDTVGHTGGTIGFSSLLLFIPEHGVAIVLLSNAGDRGAFIFAVHRRFFELLFDGKARAREELVTQVRLEAEARAEELELLSRADPAWFDALAGGWVAPGLGRIDLARDERGATLDAGEWKATVGKRTGRDGTVAVVTTSVPEVGIQLVPRERDGRTVLVLSEGQHEYVFERAK